MAKRHAPFPSARLQLSRLLSLQRPSQLRAKHDDEVNVDVVVKTTSSSVWANDVAGAE